MEKIHGILLQFFVSKEVQLLSAHECQNFVVMFKLLGGITQITLPLWMLPDIPSGWRKEQGQSA